MNRNRHPGKRLDKITIIGYLLAVITFVSGMMLLLLRKKGEKFTPHSTQRFVPAIDEEISGLTESEAKARRRESIDNSISFKPRRSREDIWRKNILSVFNLGLIGIAFVQMVLGRWVDVLTSLGVLVLNIGVNIFQEMFARYRLKALIDSTRMETTVIRDRNVRSVDPDDVVIGDIVVIGPGDQVFTDGEILGKGQVIVDESLITGKYERFLKQKGDKVYAGGYCLSGRAAYEVQGIGDERAIYTVLKKQKYLPDQMTPLEKIIDRVLKGLLLVVGIFAALLIFSYFNIDVGVSSDVYNSAASVIFSIAPAGLFFMILVTYAAGTADIGRIGALVTRARIVESLAQVNEVCVVKSGILTNIDFEIETIELPTIDEQLSRTRIRQNLGDFVHTTASKSRLIMIMTNELIGNQREPISDAPFLNVYGWSAISIDEEDMRGVYILGMPDVLSPFLQPDLDYTVHDSDETTSQGGLGNRLSKITRIFRRNKNPDTENLESYEETKGQPNLFEEDLENNGHGKLNTGFTKRIFSRLGGLVNRDEKQKIESKESREEELPSTELLFAYHPEIYKLHDDQQKPHIKQGLIPLAKVNFREGVTEIASETIKNLSDSEIELKIFSKDDPQSMRGVLEQAGIHESDLQSLEMISGSDLEKLPEMKYLEALDVYSLFTSIQPQMMSRIVEALRSLHRYIAVFGNGVKDIPALMSANVAIVRYDSSQAALSVSDMVMLSNQPGVLKKVLEKGQRIVNGLLAILKLYLTQALYLTLLIIATHFLARGFPYKSAQGSVISIVTITIPALGLTLFSKPGVKDSTQFGKILSRFVLPAAVSISAAASAVYKYFVLSSGEIAYAQLAVTYCLVYCGLVLVVFVSPPFHFLSSGTEYSGDWKPTIMVIILFFVFMFAAPLRITEKFFELDVLNQQSDYLFIGLVVICWAVVLQILWRLWPLSQRFRKLKL